MSFNRTHCCIRRPAVRAAAALLWFTVFASGSAQTDEPVLDPDAAGTSYIIAFPDTTGNRIDPRFPNNQVQTEASIWIFTAVANSVTITRNGVQTVLQLAPGAFRQYLFQPQDLVDSIDKPTRPMCSVKSEYPVVLYCFYIGAQSMEAWTPMPVETWGTEYHCAMAPWGFVKNVDSLARTRVITKQKPAPSELLVIAAFDSTHVNFVLPPTGTWAKAPNGTVTLMSGQAYQLQSGTDSTLQNLDGTIVQADRPVSVVSGNTRAKFSTDESITSNAAKGMLMEAMTPVEQLGRSFTFMPDWDSHRPGNGSSFERTLEYVHLCNTVGVPDTGYYLQPGGANRVRFITGANAVSEFSLGQGTATCYESSRPVQAVQYAGDIVHFVGSTPCNGGPCVDYSMAAPYMVTMVPREQWVTFAPYVVPANPSTMVHYIDVVTDTNSSADIVRENLQPFPFTRRIAGTDLIWGVMAVEPGKDHWLMSRGGGRFWGFVYGSVDGQEAFRPGNTPEYEEYSALSYAYPLSPSRNALLPPDSVAIDSSYQSCMRGVLRYHSVKGTAVGLRSVRLDTGSANARLAYVLPAQGDEVVGRTDVTVMVVPLDTLQPVSAQVIFTDRTGRAIRRTFTARPYSAPASPNLLVFDSLAVASGLRRTVTFTSNAPVSVTASSVNLMHGDAHFVIVSTSPALPATLPPGGSIAVTVQTANAATAVGAGDTLVLHLDCQETRVPLAIVKYDGAVIEVPDLDFGIFHFGVDGTRSIPLKICNVGAGQIAFGNPNDPAMPITWDDRKHFSIAPSDLSTLAITVLHAGECISLDVFCAPADTGRITTTARIWGTTRLERDTSVWTAVIHTGAGVNAGHVWRGRLDVSPTLEALRIDYELEEAATVRLEVFDMRGVRQTVLMDGRAEPGEHRSMWSTAGMPSGIYYVRLACNGANRVVSCIVVR
ncbi:MAG TPA: IgGFc-binding protein [Candidatus Kapabacteria bacterium]|nr:IgGFc-binding protein [Candidatus Kapabacteria bacterium]